MLTAFIAKSQAGYHHRGEANPVQGLGYAARHRLARSTRKIVVFRRRPWQPTGQRAAFLLFRPPATGCSIPQHPARSLPCHRPQAPPRHAAPGGTGRTGKGFA